MKPSRDWTLCRVKFRGRWHKAYVNPDSENKVSKALAKRLSKEFGDSKLPGSYFQASIEDVGFRTIHESLIELAVAPKK